MKFYDELLILFWSKIITRCYFQNTAIITIKDKYQKLL